MRLSSNVRLASRTGAVLARILAIGVLATAAVGAQAQTPAVRPPGAGPGAGGPGGGRQMPPEMQAKMKAWRAYGEAHKNVGELGRKMGRIARMDKEKGLELSKPQAAKLVAILNTWHGKPAMTEPQAAQVQKQIMAILTQAQAKHVNQPGGAGPGGGGRMGRGGGPAMRGPGGGPGMSGPAVRPGPGGPAPAPAGAPRPGGPGGPGPGRMAGGGRMGGGGMGSGRRGGGMMNFPDPPKGGYNPLNPATNPMNARRPEAKKEMDTFLTDLQKRAKGK